MKACRLAMSALAAIMLAGTPGEAAEFKNGTAFGLDTVPEELVVERRACEPVRFRLDLGPSDIWTPAAQKNCPLR